jgi:YD repeat-containing protein
MSLADVNGDGIDDVVTLHADTNEVCIQAWGTGTDLLLLDAPRCVELDTGRAPEPAVYQDETGAETYCGFKTMVEPAPWRLRVWDVDGDGRHDVVVQHLQEDADYPSEDNVYRPDGEVYRVHLDATGTWKSGAFPLGDAGPFVDVGSVVGDFDGDGRLDLLAFAPNHVGRVLLQKKRTADLMTGVVDENAAHEAERVEYSTTWGAKASSWPRNPARYPAYVSDPDEDVLVPDPMFAGQYPVKSMRRGLEVVRKHDVYQGDDIGAYLHHEYTYADPTFDLRGRGFLGFRVVDHYLPDVPTEEVTFYDNFHSDYDPATNQGGVYPGAMRPVEVIRMTPILRPDSPGALDLPLVPARVSRLTSTYKRAPGMAPQSYFVHLDTWQHREWEQDLWEADADSIPRLYDDDAFDDEPRAAPTELHATSPIKTLLGERKYDALGNLTEDHVVNPQGQYRLTKMSYHPPDLVHWRLGLTRTEDVAVGALGTSVEFRHVEMEYDEGLLWKVLVEKDDPDPAIPSTVTFDRNDDGSVIKTTRAADGVADRFQTFEYGDEERMFVTRAENALGHATRALTHPAFGVVIASRDPNNVLTTRQINDRGMVTRVQRAGSAAVAVAYADRASNGITVTATSTADASVSITDYDLRGRPIESRRSGFDGTLIHTKSVYDQLGRPIRWSLPGFGQPSTSEGHRTFDSLGRILSVSPPGSLATTYEHTFLTTEITTPGDASSPETKTKITRDLDGRIASSEQYDAEAGEWLETKYLYGDFDLLSKIVDPHGNETTFEHDKLGRRTFSDEPDAGQTWLEYDGLGDLTKRIAGGSVTEYTERDALGRLVEQVNDDGVTTLHLGHQAARDRQARPIGEPRRRRPRLHL